MKFLVSQLSYFVSDRQARQNLRALLRYLAYVLVVILVFTVLFHILMEHFEGESHSWLTGLYWTLTVMSTLGFGDITFHSDVGRVFSVVVLLSGIFLLLIMLPFAFIRYFYAPWVEAQIRFQAPRSVPPDIAGHVIICHFDSIAHGLIRKLAFNHIPYFVIEPDPVAAAQLIAEGISTVTGEIDGRATYENVRVNAARMVFANAEDTTNTNIVLTVRDVAPEVPVFALAAEKDSIDILELSGATHVLSLKQRLGEHLAARITGGSGGVHVVGRFKNLQIVELMVDETDLAGKTLQEARLRERTGVNVIGVWKQGRLQAAHAELKLEAGGVVVAIGTQRQIGQLDDLVDTDPVSAAEHPVLVIGGGKVGRAAAAALELRGIPVRMVEKDERLGNSLRKRLAPVLDRLVIGDAADRMVLREAGLREARAVALTTNDDAVNIHLTVYCRRLKPELNVVSRLTHERNLEAIYRAGADSALSYASLGQEYVIAGLLGREPVMVGEGADFFLVPLPQSLVGRPLSQSQIGEQTGLLVIGVEQDGQPLDNPSPDMPLASGCQLLMLGTAAQRAAFSEKFG